MKSASAVPTPLERAMAWMEALNLGLLALGLSFAVVILVPQQTPNAFLLWALGVLFPVEALYLLGDRLSNRGLRIGLCLLVYGLALLIPPHWLLRVAWGLSCFPVLLAAAFLGRPQGKVLLSVPQLYHPLWPLLIYAFSRALNRPLLSALAGGLTLLLLLTLLVHRNQKRLLDSLRNEGDTAVSLPGILRLNRRVLILFVILGLGVILAVPWLYDQFPHREQTPQPQPQVQAVTETLPAPELIEKKGGVGDTPLWTLTRDAMVNFSVILVAVAFGGMVLLSLIVLIRRLMELDNRSPTHSAIKEGRFIIEDLETEVPEARRQREEQGPWEARIRRRYARLIRRRAPREAELAPMTPTQLEDTAALGRSPEAETVHRLYEQARYSPVPPTREDHRAMKEAIEALE